MFGLEKNITILLYLATNLTLLCLDWRKTPYLLLKLATNRSLAC